MLAERLQAWKHMVGYLEDYVEAVEKVHGRQAKEYEKVLKVSVDTPFLFLANSFIGRVQPTDNASDLWQ